MTDCGEAGYYTEQEWIAPAECTPLYYIEPLGQGGPFAEALTSFVIRLAREHAISPRDMLTDVVGMHVPEIKSLCYGSFFRRHSATIDGLGEYSNRFVTAISGLTNVTRLHSHTMLPLKELVCDRGSPLTTTVPRWCVTCLHDMVTSGIEPYRPLIWSMAGVSICPMHMEALTSECPHCERLQPVIPKWPDIVFCDYCRRSLVNRASPNRPSSDKDIDGRKVWAAYAAADFVRIFPSIGENALREMFLDFVNLVTTTISDGNRAEFCKAIGLPPKALNKWLSRENRPSLDSVLRVLFALDIWPSQVFQENEAVDSVAPRRMAWRRFKPKSPATTDVVVHRLRGAISPTGKLPSLSGIAREIGMTRSGLKYRHPKECEVFVMARQKEQSRRSLETSQQQQQAVRKIVDELWESGRMPGRKRVESEARKQGFSLLTDEIRRAYYISLSSKLALIPADGEQ